MKKFLIILGILLFAIWFITLFTPSNHEYTLNDCAEDNICKEGLTLNINGKNTVITKDTCIENNGIWKEEISVCFLH